MFLTCIHGTSLPLSTRDPQKRYILIAFTGAIDIPSRALLVARPQCVNTEGALLNDLWRARGLNPLAVTPKAPTSNHAPPASPSYSSKCISFSGSLLETCCYTAPFWPSCVSCGRMAIYLPVSGLLIRLLWNNLDSALCMAFLVTDLTLAANSCLISSGLIGLS